MSWIAFHALNGTDKVEQLTKPSWFMAKIGEDTLFVKRHCGGLLAILQRGQFRSLASCREITKHEMDSCLEKAGNTLPWEGEE